MKLLGWFQIFQCDQIWLLHEVKRFCEHTWSRFLPSIALTLKLRRDEKREVHRVWANRRAGLWNRAFSLVEIPLSLSRCRKAGISSSLHFFRLTCNPHFSKLNNVQLVSCHELVVQRWNIIQWFDYYQGLIVCIVCLLVQWPPSPPHPWPAFGWILFSRNHQPYEHTGSLGVLRAPNLC